MNLPKKPRRYFLPGLVLCILLRLEIFHRVTLDLQCSKAGIEVNIAFPIPIGLVLLLYAGSLTINRLFCLYQSSYMNSCRVAGHAQAQAMTTRRTSTIWA
jgi:hypothetical protein